MSNSIRDYGILGEERVTLEPFNPQTLDYTINNNCILGKKDSGLDNSEIEQSILLDSHPIMMKKQMFIFILWMKTKSFIILFFFSFSYSLILVPFYFPLPNIFLPPHVL